MIDRPLAVAEAMPLLEAAIDDQVALRRHDRNVVLDLDIQRARQNEVSPMFLLAQSLSAPAARRGAARRVAGGWRVVVQ